MMQYRLVLTFIGILFYGAIAHARASSVLEHHDVQVLALYNQLKQQYINKTDPLIIAKGEELILIHHKKTSVYPLFSQEYHDLKSVSHVTLAVFALFNPLNQFPKNMTEVIQYRDELVIIKQAIKELPLTAAQKTRQQHILNLTSELLKRAISNKVCSKSDIQTFYQVVTPLIMLNIKDGVQAQMALINERMRQIEQQLSLKERQALFVVLPVFKNPRNDNLLGQYFSKYLGVPVDSARLIYAEGLTDTKSILTLVGAWQIESELSDEFFHDPDRMKKDLLGSEAKAYLKH